MKSKLAVLFLAAAVIGLTFGAMSLSVSSGTASAAEPEDLERAIDSLPEVDGPDDGYHWLRRSIINAAADTIGVRPVVVIEALRNCHSLAELAERAGVSEPELARGILQHERHNLARLVEAGVITRVEAARVMNFLADHIWRIINFHYC
jgi:hypothetical protein